MENSLNHNKVKKWVKHERLHIVGVHLKDILNKTKVITRSVLPGAGDEGPL